MDNLRALELSYKAWRVAGARTLACHPAREVSMTNRPVVNKLDYSAQKSFGN